MSNLRIPGPVPVPPAVMAAHSQPMIDHRGIAFAKVLENVVTGLKRWFKTEHDVILFPSSGTGGLEASVVNSFSPGDHVLAVSIGVFGERFASVATDFGLNVTKYAVEFGKAAEPHHIGRLLDEHRDIKGVLVTHNETSTGVTNDIAAIAKAIDGRALLLVDGVSSIGSIDFEMDAWGVDLAVTASQKGFMSPPGAAAVAISPKAFAASKEAKLPRHYWDFARAKQYQSQGQTYTTPPMSVCFALEAGMKLMEA
jgi:aspartate aminotransferase-like enzyme